jgi:hypothetical protein
MLLREYFNKYKIDMTKFAAKCDTDVQSLYAYMRGAYKPNQRTAEAIEKESDGLVAVWELRGKDDRHKKRKAEYNASVEDVRGEIPPSSLSSYSEGEVKGFL